MSTLPPSVAFETHFDFSAMPLVMVREAFAHAEGNEHAVYAGVQHSSWVRDEAVWNSRLGRYGGGPHFGFFRGVASELKVEGASLEPLQNALDPLERVAQIAAGSRVNVSCKVLYQSAANAQFRLYDNLGGYIERTVGGAAEEGTVQADFGLLAPGSYALWARLGTAVTAVAEASVADLLASEIGWGEWTLLRLQIGIGSWSISSQFVPSPGCPLYRKTVETALVATALVATALVTPQTEVNWRVNFDLAARSVSASCVLQQDIKRVDGSVDMARGTLVIAGLRASRDGPQSAMWVLNSDCSARLLAVSENFSHGMCECGKADHHASDVAQGPDGCLYLLSECSLHRYDPNAARPSERLMRSPVASDGHPGGQCLRFPGGGQELAFWTENLTGGVDDGASWYNRLVRRVGGRDQKAVSSWWHGPNCAETYLGRFWALRAEPSSETSTSGERTDDATIYLDWLENGRWHKFDGLQRPSNTHRWQRLRRAGSSLWIFGFAPSVRNENGGVVTPDTPIVAWSDGKTLRETSMPFFVRRATTCELDNKETLFLTATPATKGIGPATHVVQVSSPQPTPSICSFWSSEAGAFVLPRAEWEMAGHSLNELPHFLRWQAQVGRNGGGVWQAVKEAPDQGAYLERVVTDTKILFVAHGEIVPTRTLILENGMTLYCEDETQLEIEA